MFKSYKKIKKLYNIKIIFKVGRNSGTRKTGFSEREWPVSGGEWSPTSCSYSEIVITGHQDGSIKFWDASAGTLQVRKYIKQFLLELEL